MPHCELYSGARIPAIGLGTFGSDHAGPTRSPRPSEARTRSGTAISIARRCTAMRTGSAPCSSCSTSGVPREELWVTSKLWNDKHGEDDVIPSCRQVARRPALDYLDMYLVHWPFPNFHPPGCTWSRAVPTPALYPRELHEDVAADGEAGGSRTGAAHRHLQHDDSEAASCCCATRASGRRSTKWNCTRISSSRSCSSSCAPTASSRSATRPIGLARTGRSATARRTTRSISKTR